MEAALEEGAMRPRREVSAEEGEEARFPPLRMAPRMASWTCLKLARAEGPSGRVCWKGCGEEKKGSSLQI